MKLINSMPKFLLICAVVLVLLGCKKQDDPGPIYFDSHLKPIKIVDETIRLNSRLSLVGSNRVVKTIQFPTRTVKWSYWMGVGKDVEQRMFETYAPLLPLAAKKILTGSGFSENDGYIAAGWGLIKNFDLIAGSAAIDLYLLNESGTRAFDNNVSPIPYIHADQQTINGWKLYDILDTPEISPFQRTLFIGLRNMDSFSGQDVKIRVYAYVVRDDFEEK